MSRRPRSLAAALYRRVVLAAAAAGVVMGALSLTIAYRAITRQADANLITAANVLVALMGDELGERAATPASLQRPIEASDDLLSEEDARAFHRSADGRMFIVFHDRHPILLSDTAPPLAAVPTTAGFHDFRAAGIFWRSYGLAVPREGLLVVVGEQLRTRSVVLRNILLRLLLPLVVLVPATGLLLHLSLRSGLFSLRALSADLSARAPQDLHQLDLRAWPTDLAMLIAALNALFARLGEAMVREQHFTDDAAHQLRTPLAAIRIQAQTVVAALPPSEREAGGRLLAGVQRASELVDHMLLLARLEATAITPVAFDVAEQVAAVIADHALLAARKRVEFAFVEAALPPILSDPAVLAVALAAVCENAVKYSPEGGQILVSVEAGGGARAIVTVADQGPGIGAADQDRLLERFARGTGAKGGAGLGLAIASRAMTLLGGTITFADPDPAAPGLTVRLLVPTL